MPFDISGGLHEAGKAVAATAGAYTLEAQKAALEQEKVLLADRLAGVREDKQRDFLSTESGKERDFKGNEGMLNRTSEETRTKMTTEATVTSAGISASASRYGSDRSLEGHRYAVDATTAQGDKEREFKGKEGMLNRDLEERKHKASDETDRYKSDQTAGTQRYVTDKTAEYHEKSANIYADSREKVANTAAEAKKEAADVSSKAREAIKDSLIPGEAAIESLANMYNATNTLPATGYGGTAGKVVILNRAAELRKEAGITDGDMLSTAGQAKAAQVALTALQKQYSAAEAFSATAEKNGIMVKELVQKGVGPTGMPIFDAWIQSGRRAIGDDDVAKFGAALYAYATETAKVMSGNLGNTPLSDSSRKEAAEIINRADNFKTLMGIMEVMEAERHNRMSGFQESVDRLKKQVGGKEPGPNKIGPAATPSNPNALKVLTLPPPTSNGLPDPAALDVGGIYKMPNGKNMEWTGTGFIER